VVIFLLAKGVWWFVMPITMVVFAIPAAIARGGMEGGPGPIAVAMATALWAGVFLLTSWRMLTRRGWASLVGFNGPAHWRQPWLVWVLALYVLVNLSTLLGKPLQISADWRPWLLAVVQAPSAALFEEAVFRGLILAILLNRFHGTRSQVIGAVLFSSLLFGLAHAGTLFSPNVPWQHGVANIIYAALAGVGYAALVLRTRSIWLVAAVHTGIAFANLLPALLTRGDVAPAAALITTPGQAWSSAIVSTLILIPLFLYGLWLLRDIRTLDLSFGKPTARDDSGTGGLPSTGGGAIAA
jgi:membrane protease YdiL (CAAX protease family)